jgi:hypothetical protein
MPASMSLLTCAQAKAELKSLDQRISSARMPGPGGLVSDEVVMEWVRQRERFKVREGGTAGATHCSWGSLPSELCQFFLFHRADISVVHIPVDCMLSPLICCPPGLGEAPSP